MGDETIHALLIEDNPGDARLIKETLKDVGGFPLQIEHLDRLSLALERIAQGRIDVVVLDLSLPDCSGFETFHKMHDQFPDLPVVLLTGLDDEELGARAVREGAQDYIVKSQLDGSLLSRALRYAVERKRSADRLRKSEQLLRKTFSNLIDGIFIISAQSFAIVDCNPAAGLIFGYAKEELVGKNALFLLVPDLDPQVRNEELLNFKGQLRSVLMERVLRRKDGSSFFAEFSYVPLEDDPEKVDNWLVLVRDITGRKEAQETLRVSEERYDLAVRGANDGLWDWDLRREQVYFSPRWKALLGFSENEIGTSHLEWFERIHPEEVEKVQHELTKHINGYSSHFESEHRVRASDGSYRWMLVRGLAVRDSAGVAYRMAGSFTDISDRKRAEEQLLHDAFHDSLTKLPNRALFIDRLGRAIEHSRRFEHYLYAVLFLDLDRFKTVNDSLGHAAGDMLLQMVAGELSTCLRSGDTVARFGGDEFVILLEDLSEVDHVIRVTERIQRLLSRPYKIGDNQIFTSASIGIVLSTMGYTSTEEVLRDADIAMYQAKMMGKSKYVLFDKELRIRTSARLRLETDLRHALSKNEFEIHYQPIISLKDNNISGFEALLRWNHPTLGRISPADFIPIAEETGLIVEIGLWVLKTGCGQIRNWQKQTGINDLTINVNVSQRQFRQVDFIDQVKGVLLETGLDPVCLNLEITENVLMDSSEDAVAVLNHLRELGIGLHVDDFGTGYSSLSYLQRFPISTLKIDHSFIKSLNGTGDNSEIVKTIILLARELGVACVAEGIETKIQLDQLRELSCNYGQGYFIGRPLAPDQILMLIHNQKDRIAISSLPYPSNTGRLLLSNQG